MAPSDMENAMSAKAWWDAERKAAKFWHELKQNQAGGNARNSVNPENGPVPSTQGGVSAARDRRSGLPQG